ncbi:hypothetical protein K4K49_005749 [Colletotrichum sp. SAR 10_70]|nr:hypothetical protein K4K50_013256 [Colletotrichum sp. SAR 10_71]KAI8165783.1 hypothetical protein K4K49_005749 [Colletotrichum sp. SAR 10_70]
MSEPPNLPPAETSMTPDYDDSRPNKIRNAKANPLSTVPTCPPQTPRRRRPIRLFTEDTPTPTLFATPARRPRASRHTHQAIYSEDSSALTDNHANDSSSNIFSSNASSSNTESDSPLKSYGQPQPHQTDAPRPFCTPARRPPRRPKVIIDDASDGEDDSTIVEYGGRTDNGDTQPEPQPEVIYENQPYDDEHARSIDTRLEIQLAWTEISAAESQIQVKTLELEQERAELEKEKEKLAEERVRVGLILSSLEARVKDMIDVAAAHGF